MRERQQNNKAEEQSDDEEERNYCKIEQTCCVISATNCGSPIKQQSFSCVMYNTQCTHEVPFVFNKQTNTTKQSILKRIDACTTTADWTICTRESRLVK